MSNKYNKRKRATDYLPEEPFTAIKESCNHYDVEHVIWEMPLWFYISLSHESSNYDTLEERVLFIEFFIDFLPFIEAAYLFYKKRIDEPDSKPTREAYQPQYLYSKEMSDPMIPIRHFCHRFPLLYTRIELWNFFQAVQFYDGPLKESIYRYDTSSMHMHLLTLVEAFYLIVGIKPG